MIKKILVILSILTLSLTLISCNKEIDTTSNNLEILQVETSNGDTSEPSTDKSQLNTNTDDTKPIVETKENKLVRLYFYDVINDNIVFFDDTVEVTNKALTTALVSALKHPTNNIVTPLLPETISLKSAKLDKENNLLTIDFPADFVSKLNLGSGPESKTIQALVNTMGYNYKVNNIIITLDGKPYSSGHILMSEGESFKVSLDDAIQL